jgi:hypothetical protein
MQNRSSFVVAAVGFPMVFHTGSVHKFRWELNSNHGTASIEDGPDLQLRSGRGASRMVRPWAKRVLKDFGSSIVGIEYPEDDETIQPLEIHRNICRCDRTKKLPVYWLRWGYVG